MIKLATFDLDGTLITGTTTTLFLAQKLGFKQWTPEFEADWKKGLYNNNFQVAREIARQFQGVSLDTVHGLYPGVPRIANIGPTITALKKRGIVVLLGSITWSFFVELYAAEYGFDSCCGTKMKITDNILTGEIENYCTNQDKLQFFLTACREHGISLSETIAIGDSLSDHPIFKEAGKSIALNADPATKKIATHSLDTDNLLDILHFIQ
jgi:phosphoserine phosphatase